jgi:integrase/recombinase XerD
MNNKPYAYYTHNFGQWLNTLGYSASSVVTMPRMLNDYFNWLAQLGINHISQSTAQHCNDFINYTSHRKNKNTAGALTIGHINQYITVINKFNDYLKNCGIAPMPIHTKRLLNDKSITITREILTIDEIKQLYQNTDETLQGQRDKALLAVYYGCGLRKGEGVLLDVSDVLIERKMIYVRHAKNNHQRYTPITTANLNHIINYIHNVRPLYLSEKSNEQALFISERGSRISPARIHQRINAIYQLAGITRHIGVHGLRHSIATHLLQSGMELEQIALFLGHKCLDSTQIYTHIINEK